MPGLTGGCVRQVDLAVVETGLGGATDATNVFTPETLRVAVITELGREHEAALGDRSSAHASLACCFADSDSH